MGVINFLARRYAVYCPKCNHELYVYAFGSKGLNIFKCVHCNEFYAKDNFKELVVTDIPYRLASFKYDQSLDNYNGIISRYALAPKWINLLCRTFGKDKY